MLGRSMLMAASNAASAALWTPAQITTALWLDAADSSTITTVSGAVSQWNDKSGNARHASQATSTNRPTYSATGYNGLPSISFAVGTLLNLTQFAQQSGQDIYAVVDTVSIGSGYKNFMHRTSVGGDTVALYFGLGSYIYRPGLYALGERAAWTTAIQRKAIIRWSFLLGAPNEALTQVDGQTPVVESFSGSLSLVNWLSINISGFGQESTFLLTELIMTPSRLTSDNRQKLEGFLAWKWGLTANLPANHPYKNSAPTV